MKKVTNYFLRILMVFIAIVSFISARATDPTSTINYNTTGLIPGSAIVVPIMINGGTHNIGGFDLDINYNLDQLTYVNTTDQYIQLLLNGSFSSNFTNQPTYKIRIAWSELSNYVTLSNQLICNLHFTFNGGSTPITFTLGGTVGSPTNSYIADDNLTYIPANWVNGSASGSYVNIHSANGGGTWATASNWDLGVVPNTAYNVFITMSNPITIAANAVANNLTINSGGRLTLNATTQLAVSGNFSLLDDGTNGSGSYVDLGTTTIGGTCSVQRSMDGNWTSGDPTGSTTFHEISSPVSGGIIDTFTGDLLNSWSEPTQLWVAYTLPLGQPLTVGKGYAVAPHTPGGVKTFSGGTLNTGNLTVSGLTSTGGPNYTGFNLSGNPFPSALVFDSWSMTNLDASVWVWDPSSGTYKVGMASGNTLPGNFIPAENGFFVHVTSGTGSMTIPNAKRQHSAQAFYKDAVPSMLYLTASGNGFSDMMSVYFTPNAGNSYDPLDALKMWGSTDAPQLYSILDNNTDVTINALSDIGSNNIVNLGFKVGVATSYVITASQLSSFPTGTVIYLEDKRDSKMVNLIENPSYSFNAAPGDLEQRFTLHFNMVGIPEIGSVKVNIYSNLKDVYVNIPTSMSGNIFVYNLLGSEIANQPIQSNTLNRISLNCPTGYYIVKVIGETGITTGKVFIQ